MIEQNVNSSQAPDGLKVHPPVATTEVAIEYINNALTTSELKMKDACKKLGWSFPRIRSRALTIAKKLNCTFKKTSRGVYVLEPINSEIPTAKDTTDKSSTETVESAAVVKDDEHTLDADEVEKALMGDGDSTPNI